MIKNTELIDIVSLSISVIALLLNTCVLYLLHRKWKNRREWTPMDQVLLHSYIVTSAYVITLQIFWISKLCDFDLGEIVNKVLLLLGYLFGQINVRLLLVMSLQRFIAVVTPLRVKSLVTRKTTQYAIAIVYMVTHLHYALYAVMLFAGIPVIRHLLLKIGNIMVAGELLFSALLYFVMFVRLKQMYRENQVQQHQGGERKKLMKSSIFCCVLMVSMVTSFAPMLLYNFGVSVSRETVVMIVWVDPIFSAIWYMTVMWDLKTRQQTRRSSDN